MGGAVKIVARGDTPRVAGAWGMSFVRMVTLDTLVAVLRSVTRKLSAVIIPLLAVLLVSVLATFSALVGVAEDVWISSLLAGLVVPMPRLPLSNSAELPKVEASLQRAT